jgi:uncharacterized protein
MINRRTFIAFITMLLIAPLSLLAATKEEIAQRQRERASEIAQLKQQGVIGETDEGYVDFVEGKSSGGDVVKAENNDRRELYALIARDTKASVEEVAKHAAQKYFQRAKKGEYLRYSGEWRKKA